MFEEASESFREILKPIPYDRPFFTLKLLSEKYSNKFFQPLIPLKI